MEKFLNDLIVGKYRGEFIICPFDSSHSILRTRYLHHVRRCYSRIIHDPHHPFYDAVKILTPCSFDPIHWLPLNELAAHEVLCSAQRDMMTGKDPNRFLDLFRQHKERHQFLNPVEPSDVYPSIPNESALLALLTRIVVEK